MIEKGLSIYQKIGLLKEKLEPQKINELITDYIQRFGNLFIGGDSNLVEIRKEALRKFSLSTQTVVPIAKYQDFANILIEKPVSLREAVTGKQSAIPNLEVYVLHTLDGNQILNTTLKKFCQEGYFEYLINDLTSQIANFIRVNILQDILIYEQKVLEENGYSEGINEDFNHYFITNIAQQKEWVEYFLDKYPVLIPVIYNFIFAQNQFLYEFITNLNKDAHELENAFKRSFIGSLHGISLFKNAMRNNNKHVIFIELGQGYKILYKPKDFKTELLFRAVLDELKELGMPIDLRFPDGIDKSSYSWVEFVTNAEEVCQSEADVENYFYTQGQVMLIFYLFNSYDIGSGNLICCGTQPCYIDLEGLFSKRIVFKDDEILKRKIESRFEGSVSHIGMLPKWSKVDDRIKARMKSALTFSINQQSHLPIYKGVPHSGENYLKFITKGFETTYNFVSAHRNIFEKIVISKLDSEIYLRKILRSSSGYFTIRKQFFNPVNLTDGLKASLIYDHLWSGYDEEGFNSEIIESELRQIHNLDVPVFTVDINSNVLFDGNLKQVSPIKFESDIISDLKFKLNGLCEEDLNFQLNIINGTFTIFQEQSSMAK